MKRAQVNRRNPKRRAVLVGSGVLVAAGVVAVFAAPKFKGQDGAERLRADIPLGQLFAVRDGILYFWDNNNHAAYRVPAIGGKPVVCFRLPPDLWPSPRFIKKDDYLYIVGRRSYPANEIGIAGRNRQSSSFLGAFLPGPIHTGEQRTLQALRVRPGEVCAWKFLWGKSELQPFVLPETLRSGPVDTVGDNASGLYFTKRGGGKYAEIISAKGKRVEYPSDTQLLRVPFNGGGAETLARNLSAVSSVTVADDTVCWDELRLYPDTTRDVVCRMNGAMPVRVPSDQRPKGRDSASLPGGRWWLESTPGGVLLYEQLAGSSHPRVIEPPLRQSEADSITPLQLCSTGNGLFLLCDVRLVQATREEPPQDARSHYLPGLAPTRHCLMRLNTKLAGQPGFWGPPLLLPTSTETDWLLDTNYLYFTRREVDQGIAFAVQDLLSDSTPERPLRTVLYRAALP